MGLSQEVLTKVQSAATIFSLTAAPLVLAFFGYIVQDRLSSEGLKKDYVQIAIGILKERGTERDEELRKWAVAVLDRNAPIRFSKDVRTQLEKGTVLVPIGLPPAPFPDAPGACMEPPSRLVPLWKGELTPETAPTLNKALENYAINFKRFEMNRAKLNCLQEWIGEMRKVDDEVWKPHREIYSKKLKEMGGKNSK